MRVKAIEAAVAKEQKLRAMLDATEAKRREAERKAETRRKIVIGGMVLKASASDSALKSIVSKIVAAGVIDRDRDLLSDFLSGAKPSIPTTLKSADAKPETQPQAAKKDAQKPAHPAKPSDASAA